MTISADGGFTYTPPSARFWGDDFFSYFVSDGNFSDEGRARVTLSESLIWLDDVTSVGSNGWAIEGAQTRA